MNVNFPAGTILKVESENTHITVINKDRHGHGFYYYYSNENGNPDTENLRIFHSNCLLSDVLTVMNKQIPFKTESYGEYYWTITGISEIDLEMAGVDLRCTLFINTASKDMVDTFHSNEEDNLHSENNQMISDFANTLYVSEKIPADANTIHVDQRPGCNVVTFNPFPENK